MSHARATASTRYERRLSLALATGSRVVFTVRNSLHAGRLGCQSAISTWIANILCDDSVPAIAGFVLRNDVAGSKICPFVVALTSKNSRNPNENLPNFAQCACAASTNNQRLLRGCYVQHPEKFQYSRRLD